MNITMLMGSPRRVNTHAMVRAFKAGAEEEGHMVTVFNVSDMNVEGCIGCEFCHTQGNGSCVKKDDMEQIYPVLRETDMLVLASPVYYYSLTAQLQAVIHRFYAIKRLPKATKAAMLLSSMEPDAYEGCIGQYRGIITYMGLEDCGIITVKDPENGTPQVLEKVRLFAGSL